MPHLNLVSTGTISPEHPTSQAPTNPCQLAQPFPRSPHTPLVPPRKPPHLIRRIHCGRRRERPQRLGPAGIQSESVSPPPLRPSRHVGPRHPSAASGSLPSRPPTMAGAAGGGTPRCHPVADRGGQRRCGEQMAADGGRAR